MNEQQNGHDLQQQPGPTEMEKARAALDARVVEVIAVMVRGILTGMPGILPHEVLNAVARSTEQVLAGTLSGNVQAMTEIRKGMRDAFGEGQRRVPLIQAAMEQAPAQRPQG